MRRMTKAETLRRVSEASRDTLGELCEHLDTQIGGDTDRCKCGATRTVNRKGNRFEYGPWRPAALSDEHLLFLDLLRESGEVNVLAGATVLRKEYRSLTRAESIAILLYWSKAHLPRKGLKLWDELIRRTEAVERDPMLASALPKSPPRAVSTKHKPTL